MAFIPSAPTIAQGTPAPLRSLQPLPFPLPRPVPIWWLEDLCYTYISCHCPAHNLPGAPHHPRTRLQPLTRPMTYHPWSLARPGSPQQEASCTPSPQLTLVSQGSAQMSPSPKGPPLPTLFCSLRAVTLGQGLGGCWHGFPWGRGSISFVLQGVPRAQHKVGAQ